MSSLENIFEIILRGIDRSKVKSNQKIIIKLLKDVIFLKNQTDDKYVRYKKIIDD